MNYKKIFFIGFLLMLVLLSVVVVSAEDNETDIINLEDSIIDNTNSNDNESIQTNYVVQGNENTDEINEIDSGHDNLNRGDEEFLTSDASNKYVTLTYPDKICEGIPFYVYIHATPEYNSLEGVSIRLQIHKHYVDEYPDQYTYTSTFDKNGDATLYIKDYLSSANIYDFSTYHKEQKAKYGRGVTVNFNVYPVASIYSNNINADYNTNKNLFIKLSDSKSNKYLPNKKLKLVLYDSAGNCLSTNYVYTKSDGTYQTTVNYNVGSYNMYISLEDTEYFANPINVNININNVKKKSNSLLMVNLTGLVLRKVMNHFIK